MKNKKRYSKNKPGVAPSHPKAQKSTPVNLGSNNWDRYERESEEPVLDSRTDYAILASAPIARVNHFQFKSDQIKPEDEQQTNILDLFKINLNLLDLSMSTVPFNERIGIDEKYFTPNQKQVMARTALDNEEVYKSHLKTTGMDSAFPVVPFDKFNIKNVNEDEVVEPEEDENFVSDLCGIPAPSPPEPAKEITDQQDLEDWLDDVLDA